MSTRRAQGTHCPLLQRALDVRSDCRGCIYYRGEVNARGQRSVNCNWPRNGSTMAEPEPVQVFDQVYWNEQFEKGTE